MTGGTFVPNDVQLGDQGPGFIVLTGPNMGGKSTLLRQVSFQPFHTATGLPVYCSSAIRPSYISMLFALQVSKWTSAVERLLEQTHTHVATRWCLRHPDALFTAMP